MSRFYVAFAVCFAVLAATPARAGVISDIAYGPDPLEKLDVYTSAQPCPEGGCPVVLFVHGGGWRVGDKVRFVNASGAAENFAALGAVVISINYRLSPAVMHPAHVEDVAMAIDWARRNIAQYGGNSARLFILGHSAGAHLVALVATDPRYLAKYSLKPTDLAGVIPVDTASYDLTARSDNAILARRTITDSFGDKTAEASPLTYVRKPETTFPPFLMATVKQRPQAVEQARQMLDGLNKDDGKASLTIVDYPLARSQMEAHRQIAQDLGNPDHPMTRQIFSFVGLPLGK